MEPQIEPHVIPIETNVVPYVVRKYRKRYFLASTK